MVSTNYCTLENPKDEKKYAPTNMLKQWKNDIFKWYEFNWCFHFVIAASECGSEWLMVSGMERKRERKNWRGRERNGQRGKRIRTEWPKKPEQRGKKVADRCFCLAFERCCCNPVHLNFCGHKDTSIIYDEFIFPSVPSFILRWRSFFP